VRDSGCAFLGQDFTAKRAKKAIRGGVSHPSITPGRASKEKSVNLELF
jgi:hypothetical protein